MNSTIRHLPSLVAFSAITAAAARQGAQNNPRSRWYRSLKKPAYQPPPTAFALVWTALYGVIAWSGWTVWRRRRWPKAWRALGLWATQLAFNAAWPRIFFGQRRGLAALADLQATKIAAVAFAWNARQVDRGAALAMVPYVAWLDFASHLNADLVRLNPKIRR